MEDSIRKKLEDLASISLAEIITFGLHSEILEFVKTSKKTEQLISALSKFRADLKNIECSPGTLLTDLMKPYHLFVIHRQESFPETKSLEIETTIFHSSGEYLIAILTSNEEK